MKAHEMDRLKAEINQLQVCVINNFIYIKSRIAKPNSPIRFCFPRKLKVVFKHLSALLGLDLEFHPEFMKGII